MSSWLDTDHVRHYEGTVVKITGAGVETLSSEVQEYYDGMSGDSEYLRRYAPLAARPDPKVAAVTAVLAGATFIVTWPAPDADMMGEAQVAGYRVVWDLGEIVITDPAQCTVTVGSLVPATLYGFDVYITVYLPGFGSYESRSRRSNLITTP